MYSLTTNTVLAESISSVIPSMKTGSLNTGWGWATSGYRTGFWMNCSTADRSSVTMTFQNTDEKKLYNVILDGTNRQYGSKLVQPELAGVYNAYNIGRAAAYIYCKIWAYNIANSDRYLTIDLNPANVCDGSVASLDLGKLVRGTTQYATLALSTTANGRITVTGNDIDTTGVLKLQNSPEITVTPQSSLNIKNNAWTSSDGGIPLIVKISRNAKATKYTSYLTATINCE